MDVLFEQYSERLHRLKRNHSTIRAFHLAANDLERYLGAARIKPAKVEGFVLEEYFAQLERAPSTKQLHLKHIGAAYRYAHRRGVVPRDPTVDVLLERVPDKEPRTIPTSALAAMKQRLSSDREWMIWHLLVYTGMRRHEVVGLRWEDIKTADATITVIGKGGKLRHIPIHPALADVFAERDRPAEGWVLAGQSRYGETRAISLNTWMVVLRCITRGEYTAHDFRRTVASSLYLNDVAGDTIDKIMGWSPRVVRTRFYQALAPVQLQRAILKLYADDPL